MELEAVGNVRGRLHETAGVNGYNFHLEADIRLSGEQGDRVFDSLQEGSSSSSPAPELAVMGGYSGESDLDM